MDKFKVGILGAGHIAEKMAYTLNRMDDAMAYAVASRDRSKAEAFASAYGIPVSYGSYEALAENPDVDMIYVATPHSLHYEHVRLCLEHGKAVLCEKSFMMDSAQTEKVLEISEKNGIFLAEAIWTRYMPSRWILKDIVDSGIIGKPSMLTANLAYPVSHKERISNPALGGGALLDLGVYCINFALMNFGDDIDTISSCCIKGDTGVDLQESITFCYNDRRMAQMTASVLCSNERGGVISGDAGYVVTDNINNPAGFDIYKGKGEFVKSVSVPDQITGFEYQIRACKNAISNGRYEVSEMPHSEILKVMHIMDSLRKEWGICF